MGSTFPRGVVIGASAGASGGSKGADSITPGTGSNRSIGGLSVAAASLYMVARWVGACWSRAPGAVGLGDRGPPGRAPAHRVTLARPPAHLAAIARGRARARRALGRAPGPRPRIRVRQSPMLAASVRRRAADREVLRHRGDAGGRRAASSRADGCVIALQNGLGNVEQVAAAVGPARGARRARDLRRRPCREPGVARVTVFADPIAVGAAVAGTAAAERHARAWAERFAAAGIPTEYTPDAPGAPLDEDLLQRGAESARRAVRPALRGARRRPRRARDHGRGHRRVLRGRGRARRRAAGADRGRVSRSLLRATRARRRRITARRCCRTSSAAGRPRSRPSTDASGATGARRVSRRP